MLSILGKIGRGKNSILSMKKNVFIRNATMLMLCFGVNKMYAQNEVKKFSYSFNSGIGLYNPLIINAKLATSGLLFSFQLQANYKNKYFSRIAFNQFSLNYKDDFKLNGVNIHIQDRLETLNLGIEFGYLFWQKNRFSSYAYIGSGVAAIYTPKINYDVANADFSVSKQLNLFPLYGIGIGFDYKINQFLIVSAEFQHTLIPFKIDANSKKFNGIISQINFKTNF